MSDLVRYKLGDRTILLSAEDAEDLEKDRRLTGNAFVTFDRSGHGRRIDPAAIKIEMSKT